MRKFWNTLGTWTLIVLFLVPVIMLTASLMSYGTVYETDRVSEYGKIKGNFDNKIPKDFILSFFPQTIDDSFSDVVYHYKAIKGDAYAYECYLAFVIEDTAAFAAFVDSCVDSDKVEVFRYNEAYMDYTVSNILDMDWTSIDDCNGYPIGYAEIGKILYCIEEQRLVFFALGTYDGGGTTTSELGYFFTEFDIDVLDYQLNAYYHYIDQEKGITYNERYELGMETPYPYPYSE